MNKPNINLKYREQDGMMLPDLQISNSSEADQPLGRYGRMALEYLRENHPERFTTLKMDGSLMEIMHRVQDEATEKIEALTQQMLQQEPIPQTEDIMERTRHPEQSETDGGGNRTPERSPDSPLTEEHPNTEVRQAPHLWESRLKRTALFLFLRNNRHAILPMQKSGAIMSTS